MTTLLLDINGTKVSITGDNLSVEIDEVQESPRKAAEAVAERPATLVGSATSSAEAGVSGQPEMIPALTGQHTGANVSGPKRAGVTVVGSESGTVINSKAKAGGDPLAPKTYVLRPNCLQPESCGGYSDHHCHACTKIMESAEETKHRIASCFKGGAA
jgi:hypothetical protein